MVVVVVILIISYYVHENQNNTLYVHSYRVKECLQNFCGIIAVHLHKPLFMSLLPECSPHVHHSCCVFAHTFIFVTLIVIIVCWHYKAMENSELYFLLSVCPSSFLTLAGMM